MAGPPRHRDERRSLFAWALTAIVLVTVAAVVVVVRLSDRPTTAPTRPVAHAAPSPTTSTVVPVTTTSSTPPAPTSTRRYGPQPIAATASNPLTTPMALPRRICRLPSWSEDPAATQAFLDAAVRCLDIAWQAVLDRLRLPFEPAHVVLTANTGASCGLPALDTSYYCDGTIHLVPVSYQSTNTGAQGVPTAAVAMLAHEYGHHLQHLSGTLDAATAQMAAVGRETPDGLDIARRTELQAQCLAGMFFGATFDAPSINVAQQDAYTRGDAPGALPSHGLPQNFGDWFTLGAQRNSLDVCNTWVAPPTAVS